MPAEHRQPRGSADAETGHQAAQREPEADERGPRERHPRLHRVDTRLHLLSLAGHDVRDPEHEERTEPVHVGGATCRVAGPSAAARRRAPPARRPPPARRSATTRYGSPGPRFAIQAPKPQIQPIAKIPTTTKPTKAWMSDMRGDPTIRQARCTAASPSPPALFSRRDRWSPSSANSSALAATPGLSSSTPRRASSLASPGRSPNAPSSSLAGVRSEVSSRRTLRRTARGAPRSRTREPASEHLELGGPQRACQDLGLAPLLDRVELDPALRRHRAPRTGRRRGARPPARPCARPGGPRPPAERLEVPDRVPHAHAAAVVHVRRSPELRREGGDDLRHEDGNADRDVPAPATATSCSMIRISSASDLRVVRAHLGPEPVLERRDDAAAVRVVVGVRGRDEQQVERQPDPVAADLDVALLQDVEQRDLDPLGQVGELVDRHDAAVGPRDHPVVDRELVGRGTDPRPPGSGRRRRSGRPRSCRAWRASPRSDPRAPSQRIGDRVAILPRRDRGTGRRSDGTGGRSSRTRRSPASPRRGGRRSRGRGASWPARARRAGSGRGRRGSRVRAPGAPSRRTQRARGNSSSPAPSFASRFSRSSSLTVRSG